MRRAALLLLGLAACGDGAAQPIDAPPSDGIPAMCEPRAGTGVVLEDVAEGFDQPMLVTAAPGDRRLFVVEQTGAIRIISNGAVNATPFLDLGGPNGVVQCCGEQGRCGRRSTPRPTSPT
jgi:hypothetical protein